VALQEHMKQAFEQRLPGFELFKVPIALASWSRGRRHGRSSPSAASACPARMAASRWSSRDPEKGRSEVFVIAPTWQ
jgi:hypothetical protein